MALAPMAALPGVRPPSRRGPMSTVMQNVSPLPQSLLNFHFVSSAQVQPILRQGCSECRDEHGLIAAGTSWVAAGTMVPCV